MTLSGFASVVSRRMVVTVALGASLMIGSHAWAQDAAGQAPASGQAAAPAAQADPMKFSSEAGLMIYSIAQEKVAPFEALLAAIRTKLQASEKPEFKAMADGLTILKVATPPPAGQGQTYFLIASPASQVNSYSLIPLLYNDGLFTREEADALFNAVGTDAFKQVSAVPANKLQ